MTNLILQWRVRHGLAADPAPALGYQPATVDSVRLRFSELPSGEVLVESRLAPLPQAPAERDRMLEKAMKVSAAKLPLTVGGLTVDPDGAALWLQATMSGQADLAQFDQTVEQLVNEVEQWRKVL